MNKYIFGILICGLMSCETLKIFAQEKDSLALRREVSFGFGTVSFVDFVATIGTFGDYSPGPELHFQYLYNVNKHIGLGVLSIFELFEKSHEGDHGVLVTINPVARFYWFNNKHFAMYSKIGVGVLAGIEDNVKPIPVFNVVPIGMEFGNRKWRGFTEIFPIGTLGILNGGVKYSF